MQIPRINLLYQRRFFGKVPKAAQGQMVLPFIKSYLTCILLSCILLLCSSCVVSWIYIWIDRRSMIYLLLLEIVILKLFELIASWLTFCFNVSETLARNDILLLNFFKLGQIFLLLFAEWFSISMCSLDDRTCLILWLRYLHSIIP